MYLRTPRMDACFIYAVIFSLACEHIAVAQLVPYLSSNKETVAPLSYAALLQILMGGGRGGQDKSLNQTPAKATSNLINFLNPDNTVNVYRAGLIPFKDPSPSPMVDRAQQNKGTTLNWQAILKRPNEPTKKAQIKDIFRSFDEETPAPTPTPTKKSGILVTNGGVYIVNGDGSRKTTQEDITHGKGDVTPSTKELEVEVHDKPFTGLPDDFFDHRQRRKRQAKDDQDGKKAQEKPRKSESASRKGDLSCLTADQFEPCEYYPQCFSSTDQVCRTRDSYLGDETNRLCRLAQVVVQSTESESLKSYLLNVESCIREELVAILESPSCDDVTLTLESALLRHNQSSCLYLGGQFCNIIAHQPSRKNLAMMFAKPTADQDFMMRLLINFGEMTSYCPGEPSRIFVTDLMLLALRSRNLYNIPEPPVPTLEQPGH